MATTRSSCSTTCDLHVNASSASPTLVDNYYDGSGSRGEPGGQHAARGPARHSAYESSTSRTPRARTWRRPQARSANSPARRCGSSAGNSSSPIGHSPGTRRSARSSRSRRATSSSVTPARRTASRPRPTSPNGSSRPIVTTLQAGAPWRDYELQQTARERGGRGPALPRPGPPGPPGRPDRRLRRARRRHQRPPSRRGEPAGADRPLPAARRPEPRRHRRPPGRPDRLREPAPAIELRRRAARRRGARPLDHRLRPPRLARPDARTHRAALRGRSRLRAGRSHADAPRRHRRGSSSR